VWEHCRHISLEGDRSSQDLLVSLTGILLDAMKILAHPLNREDQTMILSYTDIDDKTRQVKVKITTNHAASFDREPVIVLSEGGVLDLHSWVAMAYHVEKASPKERQGLSKIGLI
jgi:hypothetical protein